MSESDSGDETAGDLKRARRSRHVVPMVVAVKVVIVGLVVLLPSGLAIGLGAAHGIAVAAVLVGVGVVMFTRHRAARGRGGRGVR